VELREYWSIIRRRWWLPVALGLIAFLTSSVIGLRGAAAYRTDMRIAVSSVPVSDPTQQLQYDPIYYANLDSEYLADDMSEFMHSDAFAGEVKRELATARNLNVDISTIVTATRTKKTHRFIDVTVNSATPEEGKEIADSISRIMNDPARLGIYLRALTAYNTQMSVITPPETRRGNTIPGLVSEVGLRTLIGVLVGIALAFLLDYIDPSLRSREEAEDVLRLPVLGEIPRSKRGAVA